MNKEQREEIYETADRMFKDRDFIDREEFRQTFWEFAKRFEQIDPKPDEPQYQISTSALPDWEQSSLYKAGTFKEVSSNLEKIARAYSIGYIKSYTSGSYLETNDGKTWKVNKV